MATITGLAKLFLVFSFIGFLIFPKIYNVYWYGKKSRSRKPTAAAATYGRGNVRINGVDIGGNIAAAANTVTSTTTTNTPSSTIIATADDVVPKKTAPGAPAVKTSTNAWLAKVNHNGDHSNDHGNDHGNDSNNDNNNDNNNEGNKDAVEENRISCEVSLCEQPEDGTAVGVIDIPMKMQEDDEDNDDDGDDETEHPSTILLSDIEQQN